jgi:ribonuclease BN (tRNA processing enzyme)
MQVIFLGTNGWYDTTTGTTCSVLVQSGEYDILFDAGNGIAKADRYITQEKPVFLFISHLHIDHIAGLHTLAKFRFQKGLHICIQKGNVTDLNAFVREPYTIPFPDLPFPVEVIEIPDSRNSLPFSIESLPLIHPVPCLGYRLEIDGKVITYCTDTGICENAIILARHADLLITECGLKPGDETPGWPHLNPENAIQIAQLAHAKRLAIMHFGAEVYRTLAERFELRQQFKKEWPDLIVATDDLTISI